MEGFHATIDPKTGEVIIKAEGFNGPDCLEAIKPLKDALGGTGVETLTPEFYTPVETKITVGGGGEGY